MRKQKPQPSRRHGLRELEKLAARVEELAGREARLGNPHARERTELACTELLRAKAAMYELAAELVAEDAPRAGVFGREAAGASAAAGTLLEAGGIAAVIGNPGVLAYLDEAEAWITVLDDMRRRGSVTPRSRE